VSFGQHGQSVLLAQPNQFSVAVDDRNAFEPRAVQQVDRVAGRFIGSSLERGAASAGVAIRSQTRFGTLLARGDTLVIVSVPYDTVPTPPGPFPRRRSPRLQHARRHRHAGDPGQSGHLCVTSGRGHRRTLQFGVGNMIQMNGTGAALPQRPGRQHGRDATRSRSRPATYSPALADGRTI
jgi:hypothetical protein